MSAWIEGGRNADLSAAAVLHRDIDELEPAIDASSDWKAIVLGGAAGAIARADGSRS
jgi:hypothetical protein